MTTDPAPTIAPGPIVTPGITTTRAPTQLPSPISIGVPVASPALCPVSPTTWLDVISVVWKPMEQSLPITIAPALSKKDSRLTKDLSPMWMFVPPKKQAGPIDTLEPMLSPKRANKRALHRFGRIPDAMHALIVES
ncbi:hypothetical protein [Microbacterium sp. nov. GSS16]|uniref:hypothetical protein n=1 Tax=Microbacterium sp. nov. GSS16 TaxID=3019890 RepID=UPI0023063447|nr:hypothetical protein [Microbacterium sp. nov. GSS16]WCD94130.1 hypothetical protein PGB26_01065 [Microbacterium sp. nov. GSS16]